MQPQRGGGGEKGSSRAGTEDCCDFSAGCEFFSQRGIVVGKHIGCDCVEGPKVHEKFRDHLGGYFRIFGSVMRSSEIIILVTKEHVVIGYNAFVPIKTIQSNFY